MYRDINIEPFKAGGNEMGNNKIIGNLGEEFAANVLISNGYQIIDRNFRTRFGEMDIIAKKNDCLHFIEVKTRTQNLYGRPCDSITEEKKRRIRKIAEVYMSARKIFWKEISIDVFELSSNMIENCI